MSVWQPGRNWAVKQADSKNGEWENQERTLSVSADETPYGCTRIPSVDLRNGE